MNFFQILNYKIFLDIDFDNLTYRGIVVILLNMQSETNFVEINSSGFNIDYVKINELDCDWEINQVVTDELIIINNHFLSQTKYKIEIKFNWKKITSEPDGFYYTSKDNNLIFATQLEPISARKFIPCFDNPNLKAKWNLIVRMNKINKNCVSNTSIKHITKNKANVVYYFNTTPLMSSYLLCLVCGDIFNSSINIRTSSGIKVGGYSINRDIEYIDWSIKKTTEALDFFESWFGIKYPLEKLDIVSIPNFSSGAMENWGLVTFREECVLLFNKKKDLEKLKILEVIYHEIAHQWFGNLVTMNDWGDLWLNEATATFFSWMALLLKYPNYYIKEFYWLLEIKSVYIVDGYTNTHPIIVNVSDDKVNPTELFDEITYSKGNVIINYVSNLLGLDNFQKAIVNYLKKYIYSNPPSGNVLFEYFNLYSQNKNIDYVGLMKKLTTVSGYPILYIKKYFDRIEISYKTFNLDKNIIKDFPINLFLKIKSNGKTNIVKLFHNQINNFKIDTTNLIINPNNELFCVCYYANYKPNILLMSQTELMKYSHDEFILGLYGFKNQNLYLECVNDIFNHIDVNTNYILATSIIGDIKTLINIHNYSKITNESIINFTNNNIIPKLNTVLKQLIIEENMYVEHISDEILVLETVYLKNARLIDMILKLYKYQNNILKNNGKYSNSYFLSKTIFSVVIKYYQDTEFDNVIYILKNTFNTQIINNIISSFAFLNNENFNYVFSNYTQLIKSQDYLLFFSSISRIRSKQEYVVNYLTDEKNLLPFGDEVKSNILKNISKNIFDVQLIKKLLNYIQFITEDKDKFNKNKLTWNKMKDILIINSNIVKN